MRTGLQLFGKKVEVRRTSSARPSLAFRAMRKNIRKCKFFVKTCGTFLVPEFLFSVRSQARLRSTAVCVGARAAGNVPSSVRKGKVHASYQDPLFPDCRCHCPRNGNDTTARC